MAIRATIEQDNRGVYVTLNECNDEHTFVGRMVGSSYRLSDGDLYVYDKFEVAIGIVTAKEIVFQ